MSELNPERLPRHVAIIMDGNGRWAKKRLLNRIRGHHEGVKSARIAARCCLAWGIPYLTLYAFSKENWQRPAREVAALWHLLKSFLKDELPAMIEQGIRLAHLGDIENLPPDVADQLRSSIRRTAHNRKLILSVAVDYGGRQELLRAARLFAEDVCDGKFKAEDLTPELFEQYLYTSEFPDPDLVIRTSGEYRLSNFLLYQLAYAEIYVTDTLWPDFREQEFRQALLDFQSRDRRFGKTQEQVNNT